MLRLAEKSFLFSLAVINNVFSVLTLPGLNSKNHIGCHKSVPKHLLVKDRILKSRNKATGQRMRTPRLLPSHPICGP